MIELFILYHLGKSIGVQARAKGYTATWFQILVVAMWFIGEIVAALMAAIVSFIVAPPADPNAFDPPFLVLYVSAMVGAALGAGMVFALVRWLPDKTDRVAVMASGRCSGCGEPLSQLVTECPLCGRVRIAEVP